MHFKSIKSICKNYAWKHQPSKLRFSFIFVPHPLVKFEFKWTGSYVLFRGDFNCNNSTSPKTWSGDSLRLLLNRSSFFFHKLNCNYFSNKIETRIQSIIQTICSSHTKASFTLSSAFRLLVASSAEKHVYEEIQKIIPNYFFSAFLVMSS